MPQQTVPRIRELSVLGAVAALCIAGCASKVPVRSGDAERYDALVQSGRDKSILNVPIESQDRERYGGAMLVWVRSTDEVTAAVSHTTVKAVSERLTAETQRRVLSRFTGPAHGSEILEIRLTITRITEADPALNALTTLAVGPVANGALAVEASIHDAASGRQVGLLLWADAGGTLAPREFAGNFSKDGHAVALTAAFADALDQYVAGLRSTQVR